MFTDYQTIRLLVDERVHEMRRAARSRRPRRSEVRSAGERARRVRRWR